MCRMRAHCCLHHRSSTNGNSSECFNTVSGEVSVIIALMAVFGELQPYAIMASPGEDW